jgi:signal transduction histidine kinase
MSSFLGVPVLRGGDAWGVIYCAEQSGGAFTAEHEQLLVLLSGWASIAVQNAELYARSQADRDELEHALLAYRAAREVAQAIGSDLELGHVLELISERCRPLVRASTVLVLPGDALTDPVGIVEQLSDEERAHWSALGASNPSSALLVPMLYRGTPVGVLAAFREAGSEPFTIADQELLESYAASAATRITISRSVRRERLNDAVAAADAERLRWARELHDQTLQGLAGLRLLLTSGGKEIADQAVAIIDEEIASLRAIVADLRPPSLESEGWSGALEALVARQRRPGGPKITLTVDPQTEEAPPDILAEAFRIVQEALTNALRHAAASVVSIDVSCAAHQLAVCVRDDGRGFDPSEPGGGGMGLVGMRERVELAGGTLEVRSGADGTSVVVLLGARGSAIESS